MPTLQKLPESASNLRLERPSAALAASFAAMRDAFVAAGTDQWTDAEVLAHQDPVAFAEMLCGWSEGRNLPDGWGPADAYWIVLGEVVVGQCDVRHPLTPRLQNVGGHIGYYVHPDHRNRGIATFALREALKVLAAKGETEALVTCAESNEPSICVIEKCGGHRIEDSTRGRRRYLIPLGQIDVLGS